MKEVISFTATGQNKREVVENALQMYRDFIDDQEALFPSNTIAQFDPDLMEESTHTGNVMVRLVRWNGHVTISQSTK